MKNTSKNKLFLPVGLALQAFLVVLFLCSCEEIMDIKISGDATKNLVVDGTITTDTMEHCVILSYTGDFFERSDQDMVIKAKVSITDGTQVFALHENQDGYYYTDSTVFGEVGKTYTLNIKLEDGKEYSASDQLRYCTDFDSIAQSTDYNHLPQMSSGGYGYDVIFYGPEPQPEGDCYFWLLYVNGTLYTDTITEVAFTDDEWVNGQYVQDFSVFTIREGDMTSDSIFVTLEMYSITKAYDEFLTGLFLETVWRGSPWDGPPANVAGNVSNGAFGFFRASDVKRKSRYFYQTPRAN
jgi:hypothetical protein